MSNKKRVEEIWASLNAKPAPRVNLNSMGGLPGVSTSSRMLSHSNTKKSGEGKPGIISADSEEFQDVKRTAQKTGAAYDPEKAGVKAEDRDNFVLSFQRDINCLTDPDRGTRQRALAQINKILFQLDALRIFPIESCGCH
mmetsp:Transcript_33670/g.79898  ORF Transcript_33670/g.79898 Transcript_33670/m.79898 type:complete len:140 (-) Transcript_33670:90-509(-)